MIMLERKNFFDSSRQRIKAHKALIDEAGRRQISNVLVNSQDPYQSIAEIQSSYSLNFPRASPALCFLDVLQCSRSSVYQNLLENLKRRLENQLDTMTDESKLIIMLKETISFMPIRDLKQVPISIIKRLTNVPDVVLNLLAKNGFLMDVPLAVRRRAWEICLPLFCENVDELCRNFLTQQSSADPRKMDGPIKQLCECIGRSEKLFSAFADYCASKVKEESAPSWGIIIRNVLTSIQETGEKISALGKLHDLSGLLGHCLRQERMDVKHIIAIVDTLKFFVITQATRLENAYALDYQQAVRERAAFMSMHGPGPKTSKENCINNNTVNIDSNILIKKNIIPNKISVNSSSAAKRPRDPDFRAPSNVPIPPPKPLSADVVLKSILEVFKEAYKWLKDMDKGEIFASKVSDSIAPGYSRLIKNPMYLQKIHEKIKAKSYGDMEDMSNDVTLMFENCIAFNNPTSNYGKLAIKLLKRWDEVKGKYASKLTSIITGSAARSKNAPDRSSEEEQIRESAQAQAHVSRIPERAREAKITKKLLIQESDSDDEEFEAAPKRHKTATSPMHSHNSSGSGRPKHIESSTTRHPLPVPTPAPAPVPAPQAPIGPTLSVELDKDMDDKTALSAVLQAAWEFLSVADVDSTFSVAVTDAIAPGYSAEIKDPMNLSFIQLKIGRKKYKSMESFDRDVTLMFNNCIQYDRDLSYYSTFSRQMLSLWGKTKLQLEDALKNRRSIGKNSGGVSLKDNNDKVRSDRVTDVSVVPPGHTQAEKQSVAPERSSDKDADTHSAVMNKSFRQEEVVENKIRSERADIVTVKETSAKLESNIDSKDITIKENGLVRNDTTVAAPSAPVHPPLPIPVSSSSSMQSPATSNAYIEVKDIKSEADTSHLKTLSSDSISAPAVTYTPAGDEQEYDAALLAGDAGDEMDIVDTEGADGTDSMAAAVTATTAADPSTTSTSTLISAPSLNHRGQGKGQDQGSSSNSLPMNPPAPTTASASAPAPAPSPAVPPTMPELPIPSPILLSSRKADAYLKSSVAVHQKGVDYELPGVQADGKLLWILSILRDPAVQVLLLKFLASRLSDMLKSKNAALIQPRKNMGGIGGSGVQVGLLGAVMGKKILYPNDDVVCKLALQLCQLSMSNGHELQALDQSLLRCEIPMIMLDVLCCSTDTSRMESSPDNKVDSLSSYIAKSSEYRQHVDIAKHAVDTSALFRLQTSPCIADCEMQLHRIYLESLAKHLLELNPPCTVRAT